MGKLPSFQFYPGDWLRDQIAGCSWAAQGLWLRLMIIAHDAEPYGHLAINGVSIPHENLARMCGGTLSEYTAMITELDRVGIPSYTPDGVMYSRRMVADAQKRETNAQHQAAYKARVSQESWAGKAPVRPESENGKVEVRARSDPSSSSSSSSVFPLPSAEGEHGNVPSSRPAAGGEPRRATAGGEKGGAMPSRDEALAEARTLGLPAWKCEAWWSQMEGFGWVVKDRPVRNWRALLKHQLALWRRDGSKADPPFVAKKVASQAAKSELTLKAKPNKYLVQKPMCPEQVAAGVAAAKAMREAVK